MKTVALPDGVMVPAAGLGTWKIGDSPRSRPGEIAALRRGIELGMTLIDTAEMYGEGASEELIAEAVAGRRDSVFLVSKVYPHNASRRGVADACERSLKRLHTDRIDLYLLHWRGSVPLEETLEGFAELRHVGKIRAFGVSNFDTSDLTEARRLPHGADIGANQILYNLSRRGPELDLIPWCREHKVPIMAYSPVEQGRILNKAPLQKVAEARGVSAAQIALAWLLMQDQLIAIPKAASVAHVEENRAAADLVLEPEELKALDSAFPRPQNRQPLEML